MRINSEIILLSQYHMHREILKTLLQITKYSNKNRAPPQKHSEWPTTRQIADAHDVSIYKARLLLLELTKIGLVIVTDEPVNNSLRWYPYNTYIVQ